ncbi:efflux RND transporter periplasmic adaptor subunit [Campylobacter sp. 19-13652]|uniref:efflux RND transporter periplasmic adaptor subunit n=1 Tax=Campylobacter sp. 19-13652 TaxID=2840180 RepID=UPI001C788B12|nr:efflux RND transporter periplasmic adaptor subunit [Campylobacter sp. 19-13652]BCX78666.1 hemolysin D [Campylobacter sp. 19-13652]
MKWYLTMPVLAALVFSGCDILSSKEESKQAATPQAYPAMPVDVITVSAQDLPLSFTYPARLESPQNVNLLPKVSGTIISQNFKAGQKVKKGEVLFKLDPDMYAAQAQSARAAAKSAEAEYNRISALFKKGASSQKEMDNAKASKDSTEAALKIAELNLNYTSIIAPFSGTISDKLADVGSFAIANQTPLARLTKTDEIDAVYYISDVDALAAGQKLQSKEWSKENQKATLNIAGKSYEGEVKFIDSVIDANTGSILAKASFKNVDSSLFVGAVGDVTVSGFIQKNGFKIPQIAVLQDATSAYVLLAKDGKAYKQNINVVYQTPEYVVINDGLKDGDMIIIDNFRKIRPGAPVAISSQAKSNTAHQSKSE